MSSLGSSNDNLPLQQPAKGYQSNQAVHKPIELQEGLATARESKGGNTRNEKHINRKGSDKTVINYEQTSEHDSRDAYRTRAQKAKSLSKPEQEKRKRDELLSNMPRQLPE